jgi:hypothetical protein
LNGCTDLGSIEGAERPISLQHKWTFSAMKQETLGFEDLILEQAENQTEKANGPHSGS